MTVDSPCRFYVSTGCPTGANGQPMYVNTESCRTILYKVQPLQYLQDLVAIQNLKEFNDNSICKWRATMRGTSSWSRRTACMPWYLAYGCVLVAEDALSFVIFYAQIN